MLILAVIFPACLTMAYRQEHQSPAILADIVVGLLLLVIYTEWKTLRVTLTGISVQSRSVFRRRELNYSDIALVQYRAIPMGGKSLKIAGKSGRVFKIDDSLNDFEGFVTLVMQVASDHGARFERKEGASFKK